MAYGVLATISYFCTKLVGLERTILLFRGVGNLFSHFKVNRKKTPDEIFSAVKRGYGWLPFAVRCLDQATVTWFAMNLHGHDAYLKIGITLSPLASHAWVTVGEQVFVDSFWIADMEVLASYPPWSAATNEARARLA